MATRRVSVSDVGEVTLYKRRGVKSIRLSVDHAGNVRVSLPSWAPYRMGVEFLAQKKDWIRAQLKSRPMLSNDTKIGKAHRLVFIPSEATTTARASLAGNEIRIYIPENVSPEDKKVQEVALKACIRALKREAEQLLPTRLDTLASKHGFTYSSVKIRHLKGRWGSCDHQQKIVLNCFLMQLPWNLIDYVLLHELTHTRILAHGQTFWQELGQYIPNLAEVRRDMRGRQPTFVPVSPDKNLD